MGHHEYDGAIAQGVSHHRAVNLLGTNLEGTPVNAAPFVIGAEDDEGREITVVHEPAANP